MIWSGRSTFTPKWKQRPVSLEVNYREVEDVAHFEGMRRLSYGKFEVVGFEPKLMRHKVSFVPVIENGNNEAQTVIHFPTYPAVRSIVKGWCLKPTRQMAWRCPSPFRDGRW